MTTTADDRLFVDSNVLLYATDQTSSWHPAASRALAAARRQGDRLIVNPQVLREYLVVFSRGVGGVVPPLQPILQNVQTLRRSLEVVNETDAVVTALVGLMQQVSVAGKRIHDANIVATMQVHSITRLLTNNEADFARFSHLITVVPLRSFL